MASGDTVLSISGAAVKHVTNGEPYPSFGTQTTEFTSGTGTITGGGTTSAGLTLVEGKSAPGGTGGLWLAALTFDPAKKYDITITEH